MIAESESPLLNLRVLLEIPRARALEQEQSRGKHNGEGNWACSSHLRFFHETANEKTQHSLTGEPEPRQWLWDAGSRLGVGIPGDWS